MIGTEQFHRKRPFQVYALYLRQRSVPKVDNPLRGVHAQQIHVARFLRQSKILRPGDSFAQEHQLYQSEFLRWKNVRSQIQIIVRVIDQLEGQHEEIVRLILAVENKIRDRKSVV